MCGLAFYEWEIECWNKLTDTYSQIHRQVSHVFVESYCFFPFVRSWCFYFCGTVDFILFEFYANCFLLCVIQCNNNNFAATITVMSENACSFGKVSAMIAFYLKVQKCHRMVNGIYFRVDWTVFTRTDYRISNTWLCIRFPFYDFLPFYEYCFTASNFFFVSFATLRAFEYECFIHVTIFIWAKSHFRPFVCIICIYDTK